MSRITNASSPGNSNATASRDLRDVDINQFLDLLIAQLQNQDPLNPMDNKDMMEQIGQIRQISSTNKLTDTLGAVLEGQNFTTASSLIGKKVAALTDDGSNVEGIVDRVSVDQIDDGETTRKLRVHIGDKSIDLKNIRNVVAA